MVLWYVLILAVALVNVQICRKGFYDDYLGKEQCNAIKGVFIMLVFLAHALTAVKQCGNPIGSGLDKAAHTIHHQIGQLVVVMFLFYSGYGVMKSLMAKGEDYLKTYPKNRLLTTLLNFDVAVLCFIILSWMIGNRPSLPTIGLSLIGWENVGNSNWYIFVILCCYLAFYIVFKLVHFQYKEEGALLLTLVMIAGMFILYKVKTSVWYNTILVFPVGVIYALYSNDLERIIQRRYWLCLLLLVATFLFLQIFKVHPLYGVTHNVKAILFGLLVVVLSMKVRVKNKWLVWCGVNLFPLYIYQRLPMIAIREFVGPEWVFANRNQYIGISFAVTVLITLLYGKCFQIRLK